MSTKKPHHLKLDPYKVSLERHEIDYLRTRYKFWDVEDLSFKDCKGVVKYLIKKVGGHGRKKIYRELDKLFDRKP